MADLMICSVENCGKRHKAKGLCRAHYERFKAHGNPLGGGTVRGEPMRFIQEVALNHTGEECLVWPFSKIGSKGRSKLIVDGKLRIASRYVCELVKGPPPTPDHEAAHSCGNGHLSCIAPDHLSWKTSKENKADMIIHGTRNRGERNGRSKLTEQQVHEIRLLKGSMSQKEISLLFGIHRVDVGRIQTRKSWSHI